jgi:16S rRNA (cytosine1402-N4)-methyltransferase
MQVHSPVLLREVLDFFPLSRGSIVIDATLGLGGHSRSILEKIGPSGHLIAFEWDRRNRQVAENNLSKFPNVTIVPMCFSQLLPECRKLGVLCVDAVLFDLGVSSAHFDTASYGFSYRLDGPLDMRMNDDAKITAYDVLAGYSEEELLRIFREYGEERGASPIVRKIIESRKGGGVKTTMDLFRILSELCPKNPKKVASRIFQALRIEVNAELEEIQSAIPQAFSLLKTGGRIGIISFHSLEDRIVKRMFREKERSERQGKHKIWQRVEKKGITPQEDEKERNPRSRSARLRIIEKCFPQ